MGKKKIKNIKLSIERNKNILCSIKKLKKSFDDSKEAVRVIAKIQDIVNDLANDIRLKEHILAKYG